MSAWPSGRAASDGAESVGPGPASCVLRHGAPGVAQWYISEKSGPCTATSASPSGRTKIDGTDVVPGPATCVLRQAEPGVIQWYISVPPGPRATMSAPP